MERTMGRIIQVEGVKKKFRWGKVYEKNEYI